MITIKSLCSGQQSRYCDPDAFFEEPYNQNCSAVVTSSGWNDDTHADGFAWTDEDLFDADNSRLGLFGDSVSNSKDFDISGVDTWEYPYLYVYFE